MYYNVRLKPDLQTRNKDVDERHNKKVKGQEIYHNAFIYDGDIYGIEIIVDIPKNKNQKYSYAGHKIKKLGSAVNVLSQNEISDATEPTISINDIQQLFNPNVNKHEEYRSGFSPTQPNIRFSICRVKTRPISYGW